MLVPAPGGEQTASARANARLGVGTDSHQYRLEIPAPGLEPGTS